MTPQQAALKEWFESLDMVGLLPNEPFPLQSSEGKQQGSALYDALREELARLDPEVSMPLALEDQLGILQQAVRRPADQYTDPLDAPSWGCVVALYEYIGYTFDGPAEQLVGYYFEDCLGIAPEVVPSAYALYLHAARTICDD